MTDLQQIMTPRSRLIVTSLLYWRLWTVPFVWSLVLVALNKHNYLTFHFVAEIFPIIVSVVMFAAVWWMRKYKMNKFMLFIGCGYFWVAWLDATHMLATDGMNFFAKGSTNLSTQFWIVSRYLEAVLLLVASLGGGKSFSGPRLLILFGVIVFILGTMIFSGNFPTTYIEVLGLTDFKVFSEYLIVAILGLTIFVLCKFNRNINVQEKILIAAAIVFTMCAEISFTLYTNISDFSNLMGHIFKVFSYWFVFQAIVVYNLKGSLAELSEFRNTLDSVVDGVTIFDAETLEISYANEIVGRRVGKNIASIIGQTPKSVDPEFDIARFRELCKPLVYGTKESITYKSTNVGEIGELTSREITLQLLVTDYERPKFVSISRELDSRKQIKLAQAELEFQKLALDEHAIVSVSDAAGDITYVNDKLCAISGFSREELIAQKHSILKSDEHSEEFYKDMWETICDGRPWHGEIKNRTRDGGYYWVLSTIIPQLGEDGNPVGYIGISTEITKRKDAERSTHTFKHALDLSDASVIMCWADTLRVEYANDTAVRWCGCSREELLEMTVAEVNSEFNKSRFEGLKYQFLANEKTSMTFETIAVDPNGKEFVIEASVQMLLSSDEPPRLIIISRDITARKQTDNIIHRLQVTLDSIEDPVYMYRPDTLQYIYVNRAAVKFSGIPAEQYISHTPEELFEVFDRAEFDARYEKLLSRDVSAVTFEMKQIDSFGDLVDVEVLAQMIYPDGEPPHIVEISRDISERLRVNRAKSEFISTVSHELRTPLTSIKGVLGLIKAGAFDHAAEKFLPMVEIAYDNSNRLGTLIDDILDIEKITSGKMEFVLTPLNASTLIEEALEAHGAYGEQYGVEFVYDMTECHLILNGDKNRLMQVLANLLSNAAKFSNEGSAVEISATRQNSSICISIRDFGRGIPKEAQGTIFERFTQADSSDQREKGGTGLGLNISKAIIDGHGGTIGFTSIEGEGTTFHFEIPSITQEHKSGKSQC